MKVSASKILNMTIHDCPKAYVLGHPITHSKSPDLHTAAYRVLGESIVYDRKDTDEDHLPQTFAQLVAEETISGFSVTMPLKSAIIEQLDGLTEFARAVGVVNTVYWRNNQAWGHNTDVSGIVNALNVAGACVRPGQPAAILGGGGTSTAATAALTYMGASHLDVYVRDVSRAQRVQNVADRLGQQITYKPLASYGEEYHRYAVAVSTLPAGAADVFASQLSTTIEDSVLLDVSYDPWPSAIACAFENLGGTVVSGLEMLMYQAVDQVKLFTGRELAERLPDEAEVINAMCSAVGLPSRAIEAVQVYDTKKLLRHS